MVNAKTHFLMALMIIATGILFTSMFPDVSFTGRTLGVYGVVKKVGTISISPNVVTNGQTVTITVNPGSLGVYRDIKFCRTNGLCIDKITNWCLGNYKCFEQKRVKYIIPTSWDKTGNFVVKVYDYYKQDYIATPFELREISGPAAEVPRFLTGPIG